MNEREQLRSDSLNLLRFPLAIAVVMEHLFPSGGTFTMQGNEYDFRVFPLFTWITHFINGTLRGLSVPIFFFISGYVFFLGVTWSIKVYERKLQKRIKTLLIPFVIWNLIALLITLSKKICFPVLFPTIANMEWNVTLSGLLNTFWDASHGIFVPITSPIVNYIYPQAVPLWFVRDLMIVVLFTPVLFYLLKYIRQYLVYLLGIAWFVLGYWDFGHVNQLLTAFFFFSWGAHISISKKDLLTKFGRYSKFSAVLYVLFSLFHVIAAYWRPDWCGTIMRFNILFGLCFFYNLAAWLLKRKICKPNAFLASASFFIYVAHTLFLDAILKTLFLLMKPSSDIGIVFIYISTLLLTVGILLAVFWLLRHYVPAFLKVIAGRT